MVTPSKRRGVSARPPWKTPSIPGPQNPPLLQTDPAIARLSVSMARQVLLRHKLAHARLGVHSQPLATACLVRRRTAPDFGTAHHSIPRVHQARTVGKSL